MLYETGKIDGCAILVKLETVIMAEVFWIFRSNHLKVFCKKAVLKNIANSRVSLDAWVFICDFHEILRII